MTTDSHEATADKTIEIRRPARPRWICVYISTAETWRAKGHTHWFVCQKCLKRIAKGEPDWKPEGFDPPDS